VSGSDLSHLEQGFHEQEYVQCKVEISNIELGWLGAKIIQKKGKTQYEVEFMPSELEKYGLLGSELFKKRRTVSVADLRYEPLMERQVTILTRKLNTMTQEKSTNKDTIEEMNTKITATNLKIEKMNTQTNLKMDMHMGASMNAMTLMRTEMTEKMNEIMVLLQKMSTQPEAPQDKEASQEASQEACAQPEASQDKKASQDN